MLESTTCACMSLDVDNEWAQKSIKDMENSISKKTLKKIWEFMEILGTQ